MAMSLKKSEKGVQVNHLHRKALSYGEKTAKICTVDPEIIVLQEIIKNSKNEKLEMHCKA